MVHYIKYLKYGTSHENIDGVFNVMRAGQQDVNILRNLVIYSAGYYKGYKYVSIDGGVGGDVNILLIWVIYLDPIKDI